MINTAGNKVYPREIEEVLLKHPGIVEAVVVGISSKRHNQIAQAFIVKTHQSNLSKRELLAYCRQFLAPHKVPHRYTFVDSLPKTSSGKIKRFSLIAQP